MQYYPMCESDISPRTVSLIDGVLCVVQKLKLEMAGAQAEKQVRKMCASVPDDCTIFCLNECQEEVDHH